MTCLDETIKPWGAIVHKLLLFIRVNVTPWGGTYCSDSGDLKKHWRWLDNQHHDHVPPWQPLCLTLSPHLSIRIQSQEHICIAFTSGKYSVRLNVGAKLKVSLSGLLY